MKNLKGNLPLKITAVVLSFVTVITALVSIIGAGVMLLCDFYSRPYSELRADMVKSFAWNELYNASNRYTYLEDAFYLDSYYTNKNIYVTISKSNGEILYTNDLGGEYICEVADDFNETVYFTADGEKYYHYESYDGKKNFVEKYDSEINDYVDIELISKEEADYTITIRIPEKLEFTDRFFMLDKAISWGYKVKGTVLFTAIIGTIVSIAVLSYLFASCGHKDGSDEITLNFIDRMPLEIPLAAVVAAYIFGIWSIIDCFSDWKFIVITACLVVTALYFLSLGLLLSFATRIKARIFFKNTIVGAVLRFIIKIAKRIYHAVSYIFRGIPTIPKAAIILLGIFFAEFIAQMCFWFEPDVLIVLWIIRSIALAAAVLLAAIGFSRLKKGSERIASGELDAKIDKKYLFGELADFADNLNNINDGLSLAVDEKIRSERLKTELITNVSHDIKTPLTSIINYVDLIKKEKPENERITEYIDVLDRQSIRLKKLIEDLVEASKASTGNLPVELEKCNVSVLLAQAAGEYDEKLSAKGLTPVLSSPETAVFAIADGRRLWRVFDNLMNNICKYAQSGTRVYIDLCKVEGGTKITFKNISAYPLNISGEELTERFVRGDRSRNTEGSGLGLSIAKSLVELQGGSMNIIIDGDLFKADIFLKNDGK